MTPGDLPPRDPHGEPLPTTPLPPAATAPPPWGPAAAPPAPRRSSVLLGVIAALLGGLVLVLGGLLALGYGLLRGEGGGLASGERIGVVVVKGIIGAPTGGTEAEPVMKLVRRLAADDDIKAVVVRIDSPGGAVAPSQEIYDELRRLSAKKPTVCSMGNLAASGGFYVAMGCSKIVAEPGTLTGSIGVISQFVNVRGLVERLDLRFETIKSGKLKDLGSPFRDMTADDRAYWQAVTDRIFEQFLGAVVAARHLPEAKVRAVADGRVLTGEDAQRLGLVDQLGNFYVAVDLAARAAGIKGEPALIYPPEDGGRLLQRLLGGSASAVVRALSGELARGAAEAGQPGLYLLAR